MIRNIAEMAGQQMQGPAVTERAQIVINPSFAGAPTIFRYSSTKKGEKEYTKLVKAWDAWISPTSSKVRSNLHVMDGDMFVGTVDLSRITNVLFVDFAKHAKFVPYQ